jgi:hypothetical protein
MLPGVDMGAAVADIAAPTIMQAPTAAALKNARISCFLHFAPEEPKLTADRLNLP